MIARDEIKEMDIAKEISELWKLTEEQQKLLSEYITIRHYKKRNHI